VVEVDKEGDDNQSEPGSVTGEFDLAINATQGELLGQANANNPNSETFGAGDFKDTIGPGNELEFTNYNEPGVLDVVDHSANAGFVDSGAGGGGSDSDFTEREINFQQNFGTGPYVDRTDDLVLHSEINKNDTVSQIRQRGYLIMYWNVETVEGGRGAFARP
jgi:hypothetical protein